MRLNPEDKNHRIVIFILIAVPMFIIGSIIYAVSAKSIEKEATTEQQKQEEEEKESNLQPPERPPFYSAENTNKLTEEQKEEAKSATLDEDKISEETKEESKKVAEQFALAFETYNADKPEERYEAVKPFMSYEMRSTWEENPPRVTMVLSETKPLEYETYPVEGGSNYEMAWNVVVQVENTHYTGKKSQAEEWLWIYLSKEEDGWKVERMDITNG